MLLLDALLMHVLLLLTVVFNYVRLRPLLHSAVACFYWIGAAFCTCGRCCCWNMLFLLQLLLTPRFLCHQVNAAVIIVVSVDAAVAAVLRLFHVAESMTRQNYLPNVTTSQSRTPNDHTSLIVVYVLSTRHSIASQRTGTSP